MRTTDGSKAPHTAAAIIAVINSSPFPLEACLTLCSPRRFAQPNYADLVLCGGSKPDLHVVQLAPLA
jgi:hypothetical protein